MFARFLGFLYRVPLTNMIGNEGNGIYSAGYYIYTFFLIMSSSGLPAAISLLVSKRLALGQYKNAHRVFKTALLVAGITGLIGSLILFFGAAFFARLINSPRSYYSLISLSPTIFIVAICSVFRGYFQGMNTTIPTAVSQVVEQIFNASFSFYLAYVLIKYGVEMGAAGGTLGTGIGALAGLLVIITTYALVRPQVLKRVKRDKSENQESTFSITKNIISVAIPIITGTAIFSITNLIDMKMVMSRLLSTGLYTVAQAEGLYGQLTGKYVVLSTLPVSIATALATAALPNIAAAVTLGDTDGVKRKLDTALRITMLICIPSAIGIGVLGNQILLLLFPRYPEGGILLQVGSISIIFLALSQIATGMLQGIGKYYASVMAALIGALIKIPLNYFLISIPSINVLGAVISTIACYVVASGLNLISLTRATQVVPDFFGIFIKPTFASLVMALGCFVSYSLIFMWTNSNSLGTIVAILVGGLVYVMFMILINGLQREDLLSIPMGRKIVALLDHYHLIRE